MYLTVLAKYFHKNPKWLFNQIAEKLNKVLRDFVAGVIIKTI